MSTLDPNAVSNILKTASVTLRNQEARISELETKLASYETNHKVASIVDSLIQRGHLDSGDSSDNAKVRFENFLLNG